MNWCKKTMNSLRIPFLGSLVLLVNIPLKFRDYFLDFLPARRNGVGVNAPAQDFFDKARDFIDAGWLFLRPTAKISVK